eukprot:g2982.t1
MVALLLLCSSLLFVAAAATAHAACRVDCGAAHSQFSLKPDGSGDCDSIQAAVNCITPSSSGRVTISLSPGTFAGPVIVNKSRVSIVAASAETTTIATSLPNQPTLNITGGANDFVLANITVLNNANNYVIGKNFAVNVDSGDRSAFFGSSFYGAQDTIYTGHGRVYFHGSVINGSSDFVYGQGSAVFDSCELRGEPGLKGWSFITAHSGNISATAAAATTTTTTTTNNSASAYLIMNSRLPAHPGSRLGTTFLGRPWGTSAHVVYKNNWLDKHIAAAGWNSWYTRCSAEQTSCANIFYAEFNSTGPGANPDARTYG